MADDRQRSQTVEKASFHSGSVRSLGSKVGWRSGPRVHTSCDPPRAFTWLRAGFSPSSGGQWLLLPRHGVGIISVKKGPQCYRTKPVHLSTLSKVRQWWAVLKELPAFVVRPQAREWVTPVLTPPPPRPPPARQQSIVKGQVKWVGICFTIVHMLRVSPSALTVYCKIHS